MLSTQRTISSTYVDDPDSRCWIISNALDCLTPMFRDREMTSEEIHDAALVCGMPMLELWRAEHLYEVIRGELENTDRR